MNSNSMCDPVVEKLSAYLDDELTQQEAQRVAVHLRHCESCSALYEELSAQRSVLKQALKVSVAPDELTQLEREPGVRGLAVLGWSLLVFAVLFLAALLSWQFIASLVGSSGLAFWVQIATLLAYLGLFLLFLSVLRQRLIARKTDKYKKVQL